MRIQPTFLFLVLMAVTSFSFAEYIYSDDGKLRFHRGHVETNNDLYIEMLDGDKEWQWFHSYHMPYLGDPKPCWKQESRDGKLRTYIEYPNAYDRHSHQRDRRLIMVETTGGHFRIYRSGYDVHFDPSIPQYKLQFDVLDQGSGRFASTSTHDMREFFSFDLNLSDSGELFLKLLPYSAEWISHLLLSASDVEAFKNT